jgi:hypothetical protein
MAIFVLLARIEDPPRYIIGIILFLFAEFGQKHL